MVAWGVRGSLYPIPRGTRHNLGVSQHVNCTYEKWTMEPRKSKHPVSSSCSEHSRPKGGTNAESHPHPTRCITVCPSPSLGGWRRTLTSVDHRQLAVQVFQGPHDLNRGGGGRTAVIPGNTNDNKAANLSPSEHTLALSPSSCPCPRCAHHPGCPRTDLTASCLSSHSTNPKQCCPRAITKTYQAPRFLSFP